MTISDGNGDTLEGFSRAFLQNIGHYGDIRTEFLAQQFREWFCLPKFPGLGDLLEVCERLGINIERMYLPPSLPGANYWHATGSPSIVLSDDISIAYTETTLGHELREILENAFKRFFPTYVGLNTSDNHSMNRESDQFSGCLLMPADESREMLRNIGYDFMLFSSSMGRSLPSVIVRSRELFSSVAAVDGPVGGLWLFEAPWEAVTTWSVRFEELRVTHQAVLGGFSLRKNGPMDAKLARIALPSKGDVASDYSVIHEALDTRHAVRFKVGGFDLFGDCDLVGVVEPLVAHDNPWRALLTVIRQDSVKKVGPWLDRVGSIPVRELIQTL